MRARGSSEVDAPGSLESQTDVGLLLAFEVPRMSAGPMSEPAPGPNAKAVSDCPLLHNYVAGRPVTLACQNAPAKLPWAPPFGGMCFVLLQTTISAHPTAFSSLLRSNAPHASRPFLSVSAAAGRASQKTSRFSSTTDRRMSTMSTPGNLSALCDQELLRPPPRFRCSLWAAEAPRDCSIVVSPPQTVSPSFQGSFRNKYRARADAAQPIVRPQLSDKSALPSSRKKSADIVHWVSRHVRQRLESLAAA